MHVALYRMAMESGTSVIKLLNGSGTLVLKSQTAKNVHYVRELLKSGWLTVVAF